MKVFVYEGQELLTNVCCDCLVVGRVVPYHLSSTFSSTLFLLVLGVVSGWGRRLSLRPRSGFRGLPGVGWGAVLWLAGGATVVVGCGRLAPVPCGRACTRTRPAQLARDAGVSLTLLGGGRRGVTIGCGGSVLLLNILEFLLD